MKKKIISIEKLKTIDDYIKVQEIVYRTMFFCEEIVLDFYQIEYKKLPSLKYEVQNPNYNLWMKEKIIRCYEKVLNQYKVKEQKVE
jgi:hypothetical protein